MFLNDIVDIPKYEAFFPNGILVINISVAMSYVL